MARRIPYIDYLRGLSVTWVVWYHTTHPSFVDFGFRIPLFFFVSGIFFKAYDVKLFAHKKFTQLVIPFVLFYLLEYVFLILLSGFKYHDFSVFDYSSIFDIFGTYAENDTFSVNPPLWFICALLNLQVIYYLLYRLIPNLWWRLGAVIVITLVGLLWIRHMSTPFMLGRSLQYLIYYALGNMIGRELMYRLDQPRFEQRVITWAIVGFAGFLALQSLVTDDVDGQKDALITYPLILSFIVLLIVFFRRYSHYWIFKPLMFFGVNSYIVLGMHEIYHTSLRIVLSNTVDEIDVWWGIVQTVITLLLLWPTILLMNKYIPRLVGKGTPHPSKGDSSKE